MRTASVLQDRRRDRPASNDPLFFTGKTLAAGRGRQNASGRISGQMNQRASLVYP
ncbi:MAG: hypothetical protein L3J03_09230 [Desulfobacterales bacterium]|nr:hypothetical protein [Desulfobacterales bacterium]